MISTVTAHWRQDSRLGWTNFSWFSMAYKGKEKLLVEKKYYCCEGNMEMPVMNMMNIIYYICLSLIILYYMIIVGSFTNGLVCMPTREGTGRTDAENQLLGSLIADPFALPSMGYIIDVKDLPHRAMLSSWWGGPQGQIFGGGASGSSLNCCGSWNCSSRCHSPSNFWPPGSPMDWIWSKDLPPEQKFGDEMSSICQGS